MMTMHARELSPHIRLAPAVVRGGDRRSQARTAVIRPPVPRAVAVGAARPVRWSERAAWAFTAIAALALVASLVVGFTDTLTAGVPWLTAAVGSTLLSLAFKALGLGMAAGAVWLTIVAAWGGRHA